MAINQDLLDIFNETNWKNLLRGELGEVGKLDEVKPILDKVKKLFEKIFLYKEELSEVPSHERLVENALRSFFDGYNSQIVGGNYTNYADRPSKIAYIKSLVDSTINQLTPVYSYLLFTDPHNETQQSELLKKISSVDLIAKKAEESLINVNLITKNAESELETIQKIAQKQEVIQYGDYFGDIAENTNKKRAFVNIVCMYTALVITVCIACLFVWGTEIILIADEKTSIFKAIWNSLVSQNILLKLLVVSSGGYLVAHFSRNYSAEMHMYYINRHRQNSLNSHNRILKSISSTEKTENDRETHNAILIQITKTIFDIQDTGYLKNVSNPVPSAQIVETVRSGISK